jgi:hypothetical protein
MRPAAAEQLHADRRSDDHEEASRRFSRLTHKTNRSYMFRLIPSYLQAVHNYVQTTYNILLYT